MKKTEASLENLKMAATSLYYIIENAGASRETSLAKTKLDECLMWAEKAIHVRDGLSK